MIIKLEYYPGISGTASVGGKEEHEGPIGALIDYCDDSDRFGCDTWEQSEANMQKIALSLALKKASLADTEVDIVFAGDLMNQCVSSGYGLLDYDIPFAGLYGACSTSAESLAMASVFANAYNLRSAAVTSSHFCSAERQFRFPLEYAALRAPTSQRTVTGAAAFIVERGRGAVRVSDVLFGRSIDSKINDMNNMGAAMAPAAADSFARYFDETKTSPDDYDAIFSGDLGKEGKKLVEELMLQKGYKLSDNYNDCGLVIYDTKSQDVHSGGSGCGCAATVLSSVIIPSIENGKYKNVLFMATGALMSTLSVQQGLTIPSIAHIVHLTSEMG